MSRERASLIFGGVSSEHDASVKSFANIYGRLRDAHEPKVELERVYYVFTDGRVATTEANFDRPVESYCANDLECGENLAECFARLSGSEEFLFSLLFGQHGEDGRISAVAEQSGVRGSFENFLAAGLAMSKVHMDAYVQGLGLDVRIPRTLRIESVHEADAAFEAMPGATVIVKPNSLGASLFTERVTLENDGRHAFRELLEQIFEFDHRAIVQEYVEGVEYSSGCLRRLDEVTTLPVIRILPGRGEFYGHRQKHDASSGTDEEFADPADPLAKRIQTISAHIFRAAGFEQMCRFDFIANGGDLYFLEGNPLPGLMPRSLYTHMLYEAGLDFGDLILQTIENDRARRRLRTTFRYAID